MTDSLLYMIHMKKPLFLLISVNLKFLKTGGQHITFHANFQALALLNLLLNVDNFNLGHYKLNMKHALVEISGNASATGMTWRTCLPVFSRIDFVILYI